MAYFECIIGSGGTSGSGADLIVTCSSGFAGSAISITDGTNTYSQTCPSSSPYTVTFESISTGTWTISGVAEGQTFTETVTITDFTATLNAIPDGSTVTPTDDIQTWLHCANIWDKSYTTLSEVLSDATTVTALIASTNAVDYMARSTTWVTDVCADSSAMTKIGANDYCADSLLADSTWCTAICNSTYFESVLNVKVPTMTSDTTPSGTASASSVHSSGARNAFKAYDGNDSTGWGASSDSTGWNAYEFTQDVIVNKVSVRQGTNSDEKINSFIIYGIENGSSTETQLLSGDMSSVSAGTVQDFVISNTTAYRKFKIALTMSGSYICWLSALQYYGRTSS